MSEDPQKIQYQSNQSFHSGYIDADSLRIRMDSMPLIEQIYTFLTGKMSYIAEQNGEQVLVYKQVSRPLCTEEGAKSICNFILVQCNPQVFQGKIDVVEKNEVLESLHEALAEYLILRRKEIELSLADYQIVIISVMNFLRLQLSGIVDGFRTTSLGAAHKTVEQTKVKEKGSFFGR